MNKNFEIFKNVCKCGLCVCGIISTLYTSSMSMIKLSKEFKELNNK